MALSIIWQGDEDEGLHREVELTGEMSMPGKSKDQRKPSRGNHSPLSLPPAKISANNIAQVNCAGKIPKGG